MISTKTGDSGKTSLANGERVDKDNIRVEAYGTIDELTSFLGIVKCYLTGEEKKLIESIQKELFKIAAELAKGEKYIEPIGKKEVDSLTKKVEYYETKVSINSFVLPGATIPGAYLDIARTIVRRCERRIVSLSKIEKVRKEILAYMNRLSDLLYILARYTEKNNIQSVEEG
ncbi:cob(I)yrinic acid a,c-diamide adenosyltransferase [Thermosipho ferrireducens]|uniref:Corrinoid adenosyltransferase n=1 Tax=Thermosipho ferrireducens TaxID=2571116 RepID=A0ABX7S529_9BACT|nr:cob(I)yrinic acid a,c-diamide adenosyltransferase [Thermosipho ferrireducens]QTA37602.1 cob(I)yrinic acid a,c-diamide adenosyltransferase [Thermosipho ferrireducens]